MRLNKKLNWMTRLKATLPWIRRGLAFPAWKPARLGGVAALALLLSTCAQVPSLLSQVQQRGVLRVVTRTSPTTFYFGPRGPTGLDYDLAHLFAESLGVQLQVYAPLSLTTVLDAVHDGHADLAAAGLTVTQARRQQFLFGPPYQFVSQEVVYRLGEQRPTSPVDLVGHRITVMANSSHVARLVALKQRYPALEWTAGHSIESQELLAQVAQGNLDYTIADSNEFLLDHRYFPALRVGFSIKPPQPLAWAFRRNGDLSLYHAAVAFFANIRANGKLAQLVARYYGASNNFDYVGTRTFIHDVKARLPRYRALFKKAAANNGLDWRLLAAIGYQESHWNPYAVSPTGVRGVMMLTLGTAGDLGIENRINPKQSIMGGAQYFALMKTKIPASVHEPDRTWMALAAYNVGIGHVMDAREITRERGGNPNRWIDVRESLPLLMQKKWYSQTTYGYANGRQPLDYVTNIRSYYSILNWLTHQPKQAPPSKSIVASAE